MGGDRCVDLLRSRRNEVWRGTVTEMVIVENLVEVEPDKARGL